jgi:hypothetical protein
MVIFGDKRLVMEINGSQRMIELSGATLKEKRFTMGIEKHEFDNK